MPWQRTQLCQSLSDGLSRDLIQNFEWREIHAKNGGFIESPTHAIIRHIVCVVGSNRPLKYIFWSVLVLWIGAHQCCSSASSENAVCNHEVSLRTRIHTHSHIFMVNYYDSGMWISLAQETGSQVRSNHIGWAAHTTKMQDFYVISEVKVILDNICHRGITIEYWARRDDDINIFRVNSCFLKQVGDAAANQMLRLCNAPCHVQSTIRDIISFICTISIAVDWNTELCSTKQKDHQGSLQCIAYQGRQLESMFRYLERTLSSLSSETEYPLRLLPTFQEQVGLWRTVFLDIGSEWPRAAHSPWWQPQPYSWN